MTSPSILETYTINEIFFSIQGEGIRAGTANHFVRFSGCNMQCDEEPGPLSPGGFVCDTEFVSGRKMTLVEILEELKTLSPSCRWIILTGGEPGLQIDVPLINFFHEEGYKLAIETNCSIELPNREGSTIDWITVSPKVAEHAIKQPICDEVKYVRAYGQGIPKPSIKSNHKLISPAFDSGELPRRNLEWCVALVKDNPEWRLSLQQHKFMGVR